MTAGTVDDPWELRTAPGSSAYTMHLDHDRTPAELVCVVGWYGLRAGYRGRLGMYLPPLLEELGLVELTHRARGNEVRALPRG